MEDKSNELLIGEDKQRAIMKCLSCANIIECEEEQRPIYTDDNGNCTGWKDGAKNNEQFGTMECEGCVCKDCSGACTNCVRCYRAEYAEKDWDDYYETECEEMDAE